MVKNGNGCKNLRISLVTATFEKANTYVFAAPIIRDREVGGSNPLAPTIIINDLRLPALAAVFHCGQFVVFFFNQSDLTRESMGSDVSFGSLHIAMTHQCFDRECVITCDSQPRTKGGPRVMPFQVSEFR